MEWPQECDSFRIEMTIHLVAPDEEFVALCKGILTNIPEGGRCRVLATVDSEDAECDADLHIWNFHPGVALPERVNWNPLRHIFVVDRNHIDLLQEQTGTAEANVLLKPVGPGTLTTFLAAAICSGAAKSLRAERDEILQCLIQTNLKLQEYDHQRTAFLSRAIHDFRAPLTALSGYCGLLLSEPLGPLTASQNEVLRRMQKSAKRLSRMASAMFELSVGRNSERRPDLQPGDIRESLQQTLYEIAPFADEKSISIAADLEPADGLYFEAGQIEQVLINILDNACRFTPRAGSIEIRGYPHFWERRAANRGHAMCGERRVRTRRGPNSYRVDIADSGAPIPEEHLESIFEEYTSYAGGCDRSGGGLGLAISKRIITQHHGRIWAENRDPGPVFSLILPTYETDPRISVPGEFAGAGAALRGLRHAD